MHFKISVIKKIFTDAHEYWEFFFTKWGKRDFLQKKIKTFLWYFRYTRCDCIFYCILNDLIIRLKSTKITKIFITIILFKVKKMEWEFKFSLGFRHPFFRHTKFVIWWSFKKKNMKIENFSLKYVSCFLVYLFYGSLFYFLKKKKHYGMRGLNFCIKPCTKRIHYTILILF